jgi:hypothetical protein
MIKRVLNSVSRQILNIRYADSETDRQKQKTKTPLPCGQGRACLHLRVCSTSCLFVCFRSFVRPWPRLPCYNAMPHACKKWVSVPPRMRAQLGKLPSSFKTRAASSIAHHRACRVHASLSLGAPSQRHKHSLSFSRNRISSCFPGALLTPYLCK